MKTLTDQRLRTLALRYYRLHRSLSGFSDRHYLCRRTERALRHAEEALINSVLRSEVSLNGERSSFSLRIHAACLYVTCTRNEPFARQFYFATCLIKDAIAFGEAMEGGEANV